MTHIPALISDRAAGPGPDPAQATFRRRCVGVQDIRVSAPRPWPRLLVRQEDEDELQPLLADLVT